MALFRKFFAKKTPDRLLEISERIYVFDCCFSTDYMGEDEYKDYLSGIFEQLQAFFPDASFMVFNFWSGDKMSRISDILSEYDMTVMDYPQHYEGCPILQLEMIHHFLKSCECWLSLEGQQNILLMHCERGGWPVLAFMLAGLLLYRKTYMGEHKTLEMVYKQARMDFIQQFFSLNPQPSHLRYLHYITRQGSGSEWPPVRRPLTLDSVILHIVPRFDAEGGCRPYLRVHGQDSGPGNKSAKVIFEMPKTKHLQRYGQPDAPIKLSAFCRVQGDVVLECIHIGDNLEHKETMFRVMFNTAFVQSNSLGLNRDDIDVAWDVNNQFPRDFRAEILFSDPASFEPAATAEEGADDGDETDVTLVATGEELYEAEKDDARIDPETQSHNGRVSLDDGIAELDGGAANKEISNLETKQTDDDMKIVISQNSGSMTEGRPSEKRASSFKSPEVLQQGHEVLAKSELTDTSDNENSDVQDIQVIATSVDLEGQKFGFICQEDTKEMGDQASELEALERILTDANAEPTKISYVTMKSITKNFSQVIGRGGFGVVYLGVLQNGKVAVKKLSISQDFSDDLFLAEVTCLVSTKHNNVVRFLGYCVDTQGQLIKVKGKYIIAEVPQRLLCFEYVPNGNLHQYLKEKSHGDEWNMRYKIIKGISQGLHYLHQKRINHLDLKPENVLLDAHLEPKITDFGLSRCFDEKQSRIFTKNLRGTLGYIAPEFVEKGEISFKSDIFSFGIIMIKLLTGRSEYNTENWHQSIDVQCPQMKRCIEIAQICVDRDQHNRPTIGQIIHMLKEIETMIQKVPPVITGPTNSDKASTSVSEFADEVQPMAVTASSSQQQQRKISVPQQQQEISGPKRPGKTSTGVS